MSDASVVKSVDSTSLDQRKSFAWPQMTGEAISEFLGFSPRWLNKLEKGGFVERLPNKLYDSLAVCLGYISFLNESRQRSAQPNPLVHAQIKKLEIANAQALDQLVDMETAESTATEIIGTLRGFFGSAFEGSMLDPELKTEIENRVNEALARCEKQLLEFVDGLRSGRVVLDDDTETSEEFSPVQHR